MERRRMKGIQDHCACYAGSWPIGGESWHAIKKLFNPPFLILKVRHPALTKVFEVYCIVRDSMSGCSNGFKCKITVISGMQDCIHKC